ncbi:MAG: hypothetical protein ACR2GY_14275 [Phycisphaerales bacterium]
MNARVMALRRAAILFEMVLAIAIFAGAGALTLSVVGTGWQNLEVVQLREQAIDYARSILAELESGAISITQVDGVIEEIGSTAIVRENDDGSRGMWLATVDTSPTEFRGLSLVTLTVTFERENEAGATVSATLRQVMRLRAEGEESFEQDDLLRGLDLEPAR